MIAARRVLATVVLAAGSCRPPSVIETLATPSVGISIALDQHGEASYGVVDDAGGSTLSAVSWFSIGSSRARPSAS